MDRHEIRDVVGAGLRTPCRLEKIGHHVTSCRGEVGSAVTWVKGTGKGSH